MPGLNLRSRCGRSSHIDSEGGGVNFSRWTNTGWIFCYGAAHSLSQSGSNSAVGYLDPLGRCRRKVGWCMRYVVQSSAQPAHKAYDPKSSLTAFTMFTAEPQR